MTKVKFIIHHIIIVLVSLASGLFLSGMLSAACNMDSNQNDTWLTLASIAAVFLLIYVWYRRKESVQQYIADKKQGKTAAAAAASSTAATASATAATASAAASRDTIDAFKNLMTASLTAHFKETHEEQYRSEYLRRLRKIGFTGPQAENMFMFELMILKYDSREPLCDPTYIYRAMFDLKSVPLPEEDSWYIEHQMFLLSEVVKIWDEAEYIWQRQRGLLRDEKVRERIYSLTRYGGARLFLGYLEMMSEKAHTDMALLQAYARAEQDLLYLYRWKENVPHPYA